jgi:hypothetical protein
MSFSGFVAAIDRFFAPGRSAAPAPMMSHAVPGRGPRWSQWRGLMLR